MDKLIIIKTTVKSNITKNNIIDGLIKNDQENVSSYYKWKGKVEKEKEYLLFIKTMKRNEELVYKTINIYHNYEIPEIITFSIKNAKKNYLNWVNESVINQ